MHTGLVDYKGVLNNTRKPSHVAPVGHKLLLGSDLTKVSRSPRLVTAEKSAALDITLLAAVYLI